MWKVEADNKLRIDGAVIDTPQDQATKLLVFKDGSKGTTYGCVILSEST